MTVVWFDPVKARVKPTLRFVRRPENRKEEIKKSREEQFLKEKIYTRNYRKSPQEAQTDFSEKKGKDDEKTAYSEPEKSEKSTYKKKSSQEPKKPLTDEKLRILKAKEILKRARKESKGDDFDCTNFFDKN